MWGQRWGQNLRKGENIRKRKDGRWEARFFHQVKQKYVSVYANSYSKVKDKVKNTIAESNNPIINNDLKLNVADACILWLSNCKYNIKASTYSKYHDITYNHIIPMLGKIYLNELNQSNIDIFIKNKLQYGRIDKKGGLSNKTVKDITNVLNQVLTNYNLNFTFKISVKNHKEIKVLTDRDYNTFLNYLLLATDNEKLGLLIALLCGIRIGELSALKWDNIDLIEGTISITKTLQRIKNTDITQQSKTIIVIDTPKTENAIRVIPVPSFLKEIMKSLKQNNSSYILTGTRNYIEPRIVDRKFKAHLSKCGINETNFHTLRHTFATKAIQCNFDLKSLSEILGHYDTSFTMSRYVHSSLEQKRLQMEKLNISL